MAKKNMGVVIILLLPFFIYSQTTSGGDYGDCGAHTFRITHRDSFGLDKNMYIYRNNPCLSEQELILDFYFHSVPDKITIYDHNDSLLMTTGFVGSFWYQPCTQGNVIVGYVEYHNSDLVIRGGFPPFDFWIQQNNGPIYPHGLGRIRLTTDSNKLKIVWTASTCGITYTDMYIRCSEYILPTYLNNIYTEYVCNLEDLYIDTVFTDCGYDIFEGIYGQTEASRDTICGLYNQVVSYRGIGYRIVKDDIKYLEVINDHGCTRVDTLVIIKENIYIPNVCSKDRPYYLNPKVEFDIYDRWGNKIFTGNEWAVRETISGVYMVRVDYKGREFIGDVTVLK